MSPKESLQSVRDFSVEMFHAGRLLVAGAIARADENLANACNDPDEK